MTILTLLKQLFYLIGFLIVSWILVHFMAVFGVFLAAAIPVLHLVFYPKIICFWCRIKGTPHHGTHSFVDSILVLAVTAFSVAVVIGEAAVLKYFGFPATPATVDFVIPGKSQHKLGEIFPFKIEISGIQSSINVVQADLAFDPAKLEVVDVTTEGSFASIFLQKDFSNEEGYVRVTGGVPNPGFFAPTGFIGTVYLKGRVPGLAELAFLDSSLVLANDGKGTNILRGLGKAAYLITPEVAAPAESKVPGNVTIKEQVLGETDTKSETSLEFYEYTKNMPKPFNNVLGTAAETMPPVSDHAGNSRLTTFSNLLARIDGAILSVWGKVVNIFK